MTENNSKQTILAVDDNPANIDVVKGVLSPLYLVQAAVNGKIALKIIENKKPDLVLLDIMMPEIDGYEVCRRIKSNESTADIPVIFLTAMVEEQDEAKGLELGAVDYITKPISAPILETRVKMHLALKRQNDILRENMELREDVERITRHDLKAPLNSIINFPKIMDRSNLSEKQIEQLDKITASGYKLLKMINLSLDLYKMEMGTYQFSPISADLLKILEDIKQENKLLIMSRKVTLSFQHNDGPVSENQSFDVPGEKLLLYSMLSNLLKNALEASPRKETITVSLYDDPKPSLHIHNAGTVPEDIRGSFFEKYSTSGKPSGTGLGTYSAKLVMDTHGGTISMNSSDEEGTVISVEFPGHYNLL